MASNSFGTLFRYSTWGESHGPALGVVIDGCPAGIPLDEGLINQDLARRAPGSSPYASPRREEDRAVLLSGVFAGCSTGAPLSILIENTNADSSAYDDTASLLRPGHAQFTYLRKYGLFDHRGGGRSSARETAGRVAAGAVARQLLRGAGISAGAFLSQAGEARAPETPAEEALAFASASPVFAPCAEAEQSFRREIDAAREAGDSVGGIVAFVARGVPPGLGDPVYGKLEALLASAMLSIPASRGFDIGEGFAAASLRGSAGNDGFTAREGIPVPAGNRAGGVLGGISTGMPVYGRVAFKPASGILLPQRTVDLKGREAEFRLPARSRHDPCVAVRAVPVVEAMCLLVLADLWLLNRSARA
ncbi:MAG: chorismate synthase [Desulfovibrio sp.]|jgi:chorismate synthase|nr:chorismate synthase [Desulfovibrio sp.]